jgi:hypothetical protein
VTRVIVLHKSAKNAMAQGVCHIVSADLVIGSDGPLGDDRVAV